MPPHRSLEILGSAQPFGFGGISELAAIEGGLRLQEETRDARIFLPHTPHFDAVLGETRKRFELLNDFKTDSYLGGLLENDTVRSVDAVVSSYDTAAVFYGWFRDKPVYFYDGMLWFWDFDKHLHRVGDVMHDLTESKHTANEKSFVKIYEDLVAEDYHLTVLVAHHLAQRSYARGGKGIDRRLAQVAGIGKKIKVVGAMIDPSVLPDEKKRNEHVLVSLSGSLAPTLNFEQNTQYAKGALAFARDAFGRLNLGIPWMFSCHPRLHQVLAESGLLSNLPHGFHAQPSFPYEKNLDMIRRAQVLFASPGFSSVQEAAHFRTPLFFLPEQNGGQSASFESLREAGYPTRHNFTVSDHVYGGKSELGEWNTDELYKAIAVLWSNEMRDTRRQLIEHLRETLLDQDAYHVLVAEQRAAVERLIGGFDGAQEATQDIALSLAQKICR